MIDFVIILFALIVHRLGARHDFIRNLIVAALVVSSLFSIIIIDILDLIQASDPWYFYYNFALPSVLCFMCILNPVKHSKIAGYSFIMTAVICFSCFSEFYLGSQFIYGVYGWAMLAITAWQIGLLIRIGDVGGNIRRWRRRVSGVCVRTDNFGRNHRANM